MSRVLVVFASVEGQARRIAERIGAALKAQGHGVSLVPADSIGLADEVSLHDGVVVGGSVRFGSHSRALISFAREARDAIDSRPNAFFSVCLSAGGPNPKPAVAQGYIDAFMTATGWKPRRVAGFAGSLLYSRYNPILRFVMRLISRKAKGETDTSRDYEYTDWGAVDAFARGFAGDVASTSVVSPGNVRSS
ncbi:flavodoxin domain-containing protein [Usitatibacter palustris]|uniref:Protoporphyrinogen IX dehydrogenase [menaquinone] n=1 Tax=Usitatibacter palustris TaxID=2732487 RepID=A0A6M4H450_9PROT|nr:flavodoxin domain-containing protein [Usitatibacter palustris]QJR14230.1 Protoporphyrinogen IX dehydrogenase [menaquinone] [Usitatibacter palustris]